MHPLLLLLMARPKLMAPCTPQLLALVLAAQITAVLPQTPLLMVLLAPRVEQQLRAQVWSLHLIKKFKLKQHSTNWWMQPRFADDAGTRYHLSMMQFDLMHYQECPPKVVLVGGRRGGQD